MIGSANLSISNIAWDVSLDSEIASLLHGIGVFCIDIAPAKYFRDVASATAEDIRSVRHWWLERGISMLGMQSLLFGTEGLNVFASASVQQSLLDHLGHVCRIGQGLNARRLVFGSPRNRDRSGLSDQEAHKIAVAFFSRLAVIADDYGVIICLEPNPECYGANFMTTSAETAAIVAAVDHPAIRMQFDTGSISINSEDPAEVCALYYDLIGHVHLSEPQLVPVGDGCTDHQACASALQHFLPSASATIEMLTRGVTDPLPAIEQSVHYAALTYGFSTRSLAD